MSAPDPDLRDQRTVRLCEAVLASVAVLLTLLAIGLLAPPAAAQGRPGPPGALPVTSVAGAAAQRDTPAATLLAATPASPFQPAAGSARAAPRPQPLGCLIDASAVAEVGAPTIGVRSQKVVVRGDMVRKGQVLARLQAQVEHASVSLAQTKLDNQADIQSARTQKEYALKKAQRTAELTALKFVSNQARELADAEASLADTKLAQAIEAQAVAANELQMAQAQLWQRTIVSPLSGVVVERYSAVGERIENRPVMKIAQIDPLRVEVVLPSTLFGTVQPGQTARVQPELSGQPPRTATVTVVDRVMDAASNTFRVRLSLPNSDHSLPAGVRCKVSFAG